jgi:adenylate kinase
MVKKILLITGVPGTGKTKLAKQLSLSLHIPLIQITPFIKKHHLSEYYDAKRKCYVIDTNRLNKAILKLIGEMPGESLIIEGHLSHFLSSRIKGVKIKTIVTHTGINTLSKRLRKRRYSSAKIHDNLEAEIFDICGQEAFENGHTLLEVDTTDISPKQAMTKVLSHLKKHKQSFLSSKK